MLRLSLFTLVACQASAPPPTGTRIVSLHDVTTEMVVALGATDRLVGIAEPVDASPEVRAAVAHVPRVGGIESIVAARPTVIVGLHVVEVQDPELVRWLRRAGIEVLLAAPATLDDVIATVRELADRAGVSATRLVAKMQRRMGPAKATTHARRVFVYDCCDPPFTAAGKTVLTDLIRRAGGRNVFDDLDGDWTHVSWEAAVARQSDLVIIHSYALEGQADVAGKLERLRSVPGFRDLPVVVMPLRESLGGLASFDGLDRLRAAIAGGAG